MLCVWTEVGLMIVVSFWNSCNFMTSICEVICSFLFENWVIGLLRLKSEVELEHVVG